MIARLVAGVPGSSIVHLVRRFVWTAGHHHFQDVVRSEAASGYCDGSEHRRPEAASDWPLAHSRVRVGVPESAPGPARHGKFEFLGFLATAARDPSLSAFFDGWNHRCHPFVWTEAADEIKP